MRKTVLNVHIDRITLSGLNLDPGKAESLRTSISSELEGILAEKVLEDGIIGMSISRVSIPGVKVSDLKRKGQIAINLAKSINGALNNKKYIK